MPIPLLIYFSFANNNGLFRIVQLHGRLWKDAEG